MNRNDLHIHHSSVHHNADSLAMLLLCPRSCSFLACIVWFLEMVWCRDTSQCCRFQTRASFSVKLNDCLDEICTEMHLGFGHWWWREIIFHHCSSDKAQWQRWIYVNMCRSLYEQSDSWNSHFFFHSNEKVILMPPKFKIPNNSFASTAHLAPQHRGIY